MFDEIKDYAEVHGIPIMALESIDFISTVISETNSRFCLEVGTAIGYSALHFASRFDDLVIDTIERDELRYFDAVRNIAQYECGTRINTILADALKYPNRKCYDVVILDAAKAQNEAMMKLYFAFTNKVMIIDNIDFHGFTGHSHEIKSRNLRQMIQRIESFLKYLESRTDCDITKVNIGDGLIVVKRKS